MAYSDYYENLPKKRMGAGALFFNEKNELLIVNPTYKEGWSIPGGVVDKGESPLVCCAREVKEEIGLDVEIKKLVCVNYNSATDDKPENMQFIFHGGTLSLEQIKSIRLQEEELSEYKFLPIKQALTMLSKKLANRIPKALRVLEGGSCAYLEDSQFII